MNLAESTDEEMELERKSVDRVVRSALQGLDRAILALQAEDDEQDPLEDDYEYGRQLERENREHEEREARHTLRLARDIGEFNRKKRGGK